MTKVEEALDEINNRIAVFAPQHEGLRDYSLLNLAAPTRQEVQALIAVYDRRFGHLLRTKESLEQLMADGHPDLAVREVEFPILTELKENAATIEAALKMFVSGAATGMNLSSGEANQK